METTTVNQKIKRFLSGMEGTSFVSRAMIVAGGLYMLSKAYREVKAARGLSLFRQMGNFAGGAALLYKGLKSGSARLKTAV